MTVTDLLGPDCSALGFYDRDGGVAAYVLYRGITIAALAADAGAAAVALRHKVERFLPALRAAAEVAAVEDINLVLEQPGRPPLRKFPRPLPPERALLELDLGIDGALVFKDPHRGTFAV